MVRYSVLTLIRIYLENQQSQVWRLQKSIYRQMKKKAHELEGECSDEILSYRKTQKRFSNRDFTITETQVLLSSIEKANVTYLGDFHSFDQQSKNFSRILKILVSRKKSISIGIEFIHIEHQHVIDAFLSHHITEQEFLDQTLYHETWRFPWSHYSIFFDIAKKYNIKVYALNSRGSLKERDHKAAEVMSQKLTENSNNKMFVLFGELHIIPTKLPKLVKQRCIKKLPDFSQCIIHQNLDEVYWKLHQVNIENNNRIIRFNESEFSLQTSPPWIKYESMIYWYENFSLNTDFELNDYFAKEPLLSDLLEDIVFFTKRIAKFFNIEIKRSEIEDLNLYDHQNLKHVINKINKIKFKNYRVLYNKLITEGSTFKIPYTNQYYCSTYSVNRISYLAGIHLYHLSSQSLVEKENLKLSALSPFEYFIAAFKEESIGYFSSKVINPFLKCDLYLDFTLAKAGSNHLASVISIIKDRDQSFSLLLKGKSLYDLHKIAKTLGRYCGEMLYDELMPRRQDLYFELITYLFNKSFSEAKFKLALEKVIPKRAYTSHKKRLF